nr:Chain E, Mimotope 9-mer peptide [synthetic construct]3WS6_F Chain F, Mimotope 9-mer peptide [synthetic construct]
YAIENYLEL